MNRAYCSASISDFIFKRQEEEIEQLTILSEFVAETNQIDEWENIIITSSESHVQSQRAA